MEGGLFRTVRVRVVDDIKGVNKRDLRQWLITYKLKGPLLLINSLISASNYSNIIEYGFLIRRAN